LLSALCAPHADGGALSNLFSTTRRRCLTQADSNRLVYEIANMFALREHSREITNSPGSHSMASDCVHNCDLRITCRLALIRQQYRWPKHRDTTKKLILASREIDGLSDGAAHIYLKLNCYISIGYGEISDPVGVTIQVNSFT
jgi:hypothetical protein